ncbi:MAG TPA: hypothetical protein PL045_01805 [Chitinophagaceae bacterium]|nr:hypothetical protein [Chitinophagaceae bacterium]
MKNTFVWLLAAAVLVIACTHEVAQPGGTTGGNGNNGGDSANSDLVCFEGDILPLFQSTCAKSGCHDAQSHEEGYVFDSYENIIAKGIKAGNAGDSKVYEEISVGEMPPPGNLALTQQQVALIAKWINEGAKNTTGCSSCSEDVFTYNAAVSVIMTVHCTGCHSGAFASGGIDLSNYDGVRAVALSGQLMGAVTHAPGYAAMPQGGNKLSDCEITQLQKWVDAGAAAN